jgi:hypothetical protein
MAKIPTNELAAISWLRTVPGVPETKVSTRLPGDNSLIAPSGFVTVLALTGSSSIYLPVRSPVLEVKTWAFRDEGQKEPPWWMANQLAECIREACLDHNSFGGVIETRSGYDNVCVPSAYLVSEPRKLESDDGRFAAYVFELQMHWTRRPE